MVPSLTPRLRAVADLIPGGVRLADVGTDHAHLPVWLLDRGKIERAIATDLRPGPLERAAVNVERYGVAARVELRLGNGLEPVAPHEVDAVVIAGMGGETIGAILRASPWALEKTCLLQPMSAVEDLRREIVRMNGHISREVIVCEGDSLYIVMSAAWGEDEGLTPGECWVGREKHHRGDPLWPRYFAKAHRRAKKALDGLCRSRRPEDRERRLYLEQVVAELDEMQAASAELGG